jgi:uncharacterized protein YdcH (DUF465 family)
MKPIDMRELERRHHTLDSQIHELDRRGRHMSPDDQKRAVELKKLRLATKDQLYALRRG